MPIEINALETARFGIVVAHLTDGTAPPGQVNAAARERGVQMITARVDSNDLSRVQQLEEDGYRLMDTLVYYGRDLSGLPGPAASPEGEVIRPATPQDADTVAEVARQAFAGYCGHYHADPRLPKAAADAAYVEWAWTSIAKTGERTPALVAEQDGRLIAFLTLDLNSAEIILNAVRPGAQGRGVYGRLVDRAMETGRSAGLARLAVSTQLSNVAPQMAWGRRGFRMLRSLYTLHKWL